MSVEVGVEEGINFVDQEDCVFLLFQGDLDILVGFVVNEDIVDDFPDLELAVVAHFLHQLEEVQVSNLFLDA